jgi:starch synthase
MTEQFGFGLEGVLGNRRADVYGVLNGLDYSVWDPAGDGYISEPYSVADRGPKAASKRALQRFCGFAAKKTVPVIGIVSRLAQQKGFDIFSHIAEQVCSMDVQLVVLGSGDAKYQRMFEMLEKRYPKHVSFHTGFDDPLAHKIYAGSDLFLMPSHYEPCGLGQMIALKYGTLPVVYKTGGLADTVNSKNGFVFDHYTSAALLKAISHAVAVFKDQAAWDPMVEHAMRCDFSWLESAKHYERMYEKAFLKR